MYSYRQMTQVTGAGPVIPTGNSKTATVQAVKDSASWTTAVLTVKRSNDGVNFTGLESAKTIGPGGGMTSEFSVAGFAYMRVDVTTAEGGVSEDFAIVAVCMKDNG